MINIQHTHTLQNPHIHPPQHTQTHPYPHSRQSNLRLSISSWSLQSPPLLHILSHSIPVKISSQTHWHLSSICHDKYFFHGLYHVSFLWFPEPHFIHKASTSHIAVFVNVTSTSGNSFVCTNSTFFLSLNLLIGLQLSIWISCRPFTSLLDNYQLLCFWQLALSIVIEVVPQPFFRIWFLQECLLQTRYV